MHATSSVTSTPPAYSPQPVFSPQPVLLEENSDPEALCNLIVNYLPPLMDEGQLFQLFSQFGPIESIKIIYDRDTHESRGYGFVRFRFFFSATYAISCLNRFQIAGKRLKVAYANVASAKESFNTLKDRLTQFTTEQKVSLRTMYYNQTLMAEQQQREIGSTEGQSKGLISNDSLSIVEGE
ncbi:unnamed protein product [Phytomonas sp. Hart1]|nr:unnamed protein product [Phytomonas sp. Hart1]|eukprot:CCW70870.1 unnamed protein product [Phytomonas sp. isolate Hart1]